MTPVRILGIGSPFGDDRIGWCAVEALARSKALRGLTPGRISMERFEAVEIDLLERMRGAELAILIDAACSGEPPGTVRRYSAENIQAAAAPSSSHGFSLIETLELGRALGELPSRIVIFTVAVAAARCLEICAELSPPVERAIPHLLGQVSAEMAPWLSPGVPHPKRANGGSTKPQ